MRIDTCAILTFALVSLGWNHESEARKVEHWPYTRLMQESELVVIATAVATTTCNAPFPDEGADWGVKFQAVNTTFTVQTVIKGTPRDTLQLLHFRYHPNRDVALEDGPQFATFLSAPTPSPLRGKRVPAQTKPLPEKQLEPQLKSVSARLRPRYLLFLKSRADGRFEPLSGQVDASLSVRDLWQHGDSPTPDTLQE